MSTYEATLIAAAAVVVAWAGERFISKLRRRKTAH